MKIAFYGSSHAARHLSAAALEKGFELAWPEWPRGADLCFVSEDTPTDEHGERNLAPIRRLVEMAAEECAAPMVLTSAVPPGFTRALNFDLIHQAETLRMRDAEERARRPEMIIVGVKDPGKALPEAYKRYLAAFDCPVLLMTWEEAEFAKVAINCFLAVQVEMTNMLAEAAAKLGARWSAIASALRHDSRIGPKAYLEPGRWQDSRHLMRDMKTLAEL